ncbi:MAG: hypothetical protein K8S16_12290 [Bacteroidales bacterium]|nr:hypothetical protein [Bacteroidales bacterium]
MKKYIFSGFLFVYSFMAFNVAAQDFWEQLYFPDSTSIMCIETNHLGYIFVGVINDGNPGGLYRSVDNAQTWELVLNAGNFMVQSIAISEDGNIYIGKTGFARFMVSENNGDTWEEIVLPPPSYSNIMKILCEGQDTIFVSSLEAEGAFITRTFDSGETWEHSYVTDHQNEYVSDIAISNTGDIFVSVSGFFVEQGGVYKSEDFGATWEYSGLLNHQVLTIEINSNNDVFTGDWWVLNSDPFGIHALYEGSGIFELILDASKTTDIVINTENVIYATACENVVRSFDNGQTFEIVEDELSPNIEFLHIAHDGYLYGTRFDRLVKSINPIITSIDTNMQTGLNKDICVYPNPVNDVLNVNIAAGIDNNHACEVRIYKLSGELIHRSDISKTCPSVVEGCFRLSASNLSSGIYLLEYFVGNEIFASMFIKK